MNQVSIIGRLTANPELRHTQSGSACTRFNVAVDRRVKQGEEKQTDFITVVAWQQRAEFICKYFSKGQKIALTGSIRTGNYTDSNGNKRYTFEVWAENVEFCESKGEKQMAQTQPEQQKNIGNISNDNFEEFDGLPF